MVALGFAVPGVLAQSPPAADVVTNVATSTFLVGAPGAESLRTVDSNAVHTRIVADDCFRSPSLTVDPAGTVAPDDRLTYRVDVANALAVALGDVAVRLDLDAALAAPESFTGGAMATRDGGTVQVVGAYDPLGHRIEWRIDVLPAADAVELFVTVPIRADAAPDTTVRQAAEVVAARCPDPVPTDVEETPVMPTMLDVIKRVDRSAAAVGDRALYTLEVAHVGSAVGLIDGRVVDRLPAGLAYLPGTTRRDGTSSPDPGVSGDGRRLEFALGSVDPGDRIVLTYGVVVTAEAAAGEAVNRARAEAVTPTGTPVGSAIASAALRVVPGVFRREAQLIGRVFVDDDRDGMPDLGEPGVPGALVTMEDGRGALTDLHGRFSIRGVRPGLHVVRVDPSTIPAALTTEVAGADWVGDDRTRFLEVRASTLAIADFPLGPPSTPRCEIAAARERWTLPLATLQDARGRLDPQAVRHLEAIARQADVPATVRCGAGSVERRLAREIDETLARLGGRAADAPVEDDRRSFERDLRTLDVGWHVLSPRDGGIVGGRSVDVDVVVPTDAAVELRVNGDPIAERRIGTRSELPSRGLTALRYVAVGLRPGRNRIELLRVGAERPEAAVAVIVPGEPIELRIDDGGPRRVADGVTSPVVLVEAVDGTGMRSVARGTLDVEVEGAVIVSEDLDLDRDGHQIGLRDGVARVVLAPLASPGRVRVVARTDRMEVERELEIFPASRGWRLTGLVEANAVGDGGIEGDGGGAPGTPGGPGGDDGLTESGGRVALFARGPVGRGSQLTVSVDTERERDRDRWSETYAPDAFYPVTGDESVEIDEAPAQGKVFVRLDGTRGYAAWGDFESGFRRDGLARYDRRLTGASGRLRSGRVTLEGFAANSDQEVRRDVFEADGTSGPYLLTDSPVVARSESVVVEVRHRFRSDEVLAREFLRPDVHYDLDPVAGTLLFRSPLAAFDADLNPRRIVVLYETRGGGSESWTGGGRLGWTPDGRLDLGTTAVVEQRAGENYTLLGVDLEWRPAPGTRVRAEAATSDTGSRATAYRLELAGAPSPELRWEVRLEDLPGGFENPTLLAQPEVGTRRAGGRVEWSPTEAWRLRAELEAQEDEGASVERSVLGVDAERRAGPVVALAGLRHVRAETTGVETESTLVKAGLRGRIDDRWSAEIAREQALGGETAPGYPTRTTAGVAYELRADSKLFLRGELESGDGPDRDRAVVGIESRLGARTRGTAQYSLDGGEDARALRALTGVETLIPLGENRSIRFSAARLGTTRGDTEGDYTTLGAGYEHRTGQRLFGARYEVRLGERDDRHLLTASGAVRPADAWTWFARERLFLDETDAGSTWRGEGLFGVAFRPRAGRWRFLARLDHALGRGAARTAGGAVPGTALPSPTADTNGAVGAPGGAPGLGTGYDRARPSVDAASLSFATGFRPTSRDRIAGTVVLRAVAEDTASGLPSTLARLTSLHYTTRVAERWTAGVSLRRMTETRSDSRRQGSGFELGYLALRNLWVTAGYNLTGFSSEGFPAADRTERGPFVSLRFKFDERSLTQLGDLRLDR